jgi:tRNA nucleotidyltransferase (CCA-adding enzyme)
VGRLARLQKPHLSEAAPNFKQHLKQHLKQPRRGRGAEVWLFGSWARGDWDARSDVDLLAVAPHQSSADQLAEDLLGAGLADDVIGISQVRWMERRQGDDPWWRGIGRDAIRLQPTQTP